MKKFLFWVSFSAFLFLFLSAPSMAFFDSAVDKARDLVKANMVPQAIDLLQKEIMQNPTNAEAHLELGTIYFQQGNYQQAGERFKGAIGLNPGSSKQVGELCKKTGYSLLDKAQDDPAYKALDMAIQYNPALKKEIADYLLNKANAILDGIAQNKNSSTSERAIIAG